MNNVQQMIELQNKSDEMNAELSRRIHKIIPRAKYAFYYPFTNQVLISGESEDIGLLATFDLTESVVGYCVENTLSNVYLKQTLIKRWKAKLINSPWQKWANKVVAKEIEAWANGECA